MKVVDIMTSPVITVQAEASIAELLEIFKDKRISGVPVVDSRQELVGIVSRQDVVLEELHSLNAGTPPNPTLDQILNGGFVTVSTEGFKSQSTPVEKIMTAADKLLSCRRSTPLAEACSMMVDNHIHRLPVLSGRKLVGILTTSDVVRAVGQGRI